MPEIDPDVAAAFAADEEPQNDLAAGVRSGEVDPDVAMSFARDELNAAQDEHLRSLIEVARSNNADRSVRIVRLAERSGIDPDIIEASYDDFERAADSADFNAKKFRESNPELVEMLLKRPELAPVVLNDPGTQQAVNALRVGEVKMRPEPKGLLARGVEAANDWDNKHPVISGQASNMMLSGGDLWNIDDEVMGREPTVESRKLYVRPLKDTLQVTAPEAALEGADRIPGIAAAEWKQARLGMERSRIGASIAFRKRLGLDTFELEKKRVEIEQEMGPTKFYGQSFTEQLAIDAVQMTASQVDSLAAQGIGGVIGAGVGMVPGLLLRDKALARKGVRLGAKIGGRALGTGVSFRQEFGSSYLEFREMKRPDGSSITDEEAIGGAMLYGAVASAIEGEANALLLKRFGPLGELVATGEKKAFAQAMLANPTVRGMIKNAGADWLKGAGSEAGEEFSQSMFQSIVEHFLNWKLETGKEADFSADLGKAVDEATKAAVGIGAAGPAMVMVNFASQAIARERIATAEQQVAAIAEAAKGQLAQASPTALAQVIEKATADQGQPVTHLYADASVVSKFFQQAQQEVSQVLGEDVAKRLETALATGSKLEIGVDEYASTLAKLPLGEHLVRSGHLTTRSYLPTPAEALAQKQADEEEAQEIVEREKAGEASDRSEAEEQYLNRIETDLLQSQKGMTADRAHLMAVVHTRGLRGIAERAGYTRDQLFGELLSLTVQKAPEDGVTPSLKPVPAPQATSTRTAPAPVEARSEEAFSLEDIRKEWEELGKVEGAQAQRFFTDANTGFYTRQGLEVLKPPADRPFLARFQREGVKIRNDEHYHSAVEGDLRGQGEVLRERGSAQNAAREGTEVAAWVSDHKEAEEIAKAMEAQDSRLRVTFHLQKHEGDIAATIDTANQGHKNYRDAEVLAGNLGNRKGVPRAFVKSDSPRIAWDTDKKLEEWTAEDIEREGFHPKSEEAQAFKKSAAAALTDFSAKQKARPIPERIKVAPEHLEAFGKLDPLEAFNTLYRYKEEEGGILKGPGFEAAERINGKKMPFKVAIDGRGFGDFGQPDPKTGKPLFEEKQVDAIVRNWLRVMNEAGGRGYDLAREHPRGDELSAHGANKEALERYLKKATLASKKLLFYRWNPPEEGKESEGGSITYIKGVSFAYGIGTDFDAAEGDLNKRKAKQDAPAKPITVPEAQFRKEFGNAESGLHGIDLTGPGEASRRREAAARGDAPRVHRSGDGAASAGGSGVQREVAPGASGADAGAREAVAGEVRGEATSITTPQKKNEPATYAVVEADSLIPSHNPETFQPHPDYPAGVQEREYHRQEEERVKVVQGAQQLDERLVLSDTPSVSDGPPMVTSGGKRLVLGGNGRTMMLQRALKDSKTAQRYRAMLAKKAAGFGIDPKSFEGMKAPVLVRIVDGVSSESSTQELTAAVRRYNEGLAQALSPIARAVAEAKQLAPSTLSALADALGDGTLREAMDDSPARIIEILRRDGIVTPQNQSAWIVKKKNLTDEAKNRIEAMFLGRALGTGDRYAMTAAGLRRKVERIVTALVKVAGANAKLDETETLQKAIDILNEADERGSSLADLLRQKPLIKDPNDPSSAPAEVKLMAGLLESSKQKALGERFNAWAAHATSEDPRQGGMFGNTVTRESARAILFEGLDKKTYFQAGKTVPQWMAEINAKVEAAKAKLDEIASSGAESATFSMPRGGSILVGKDPSKPGRWRATQFDASGEPTGHSEAATFREALDVARWNGAQILGPDKSESRNLVVVHNLTAENLLHAVELGGLPAPSLAVSRKQHPLNGFGEISLLGDKNMVDPKAGVPVFGSDIYSPRWPDSRFKVKAKEARALRAELSPFAEKTNGYLSDIEGELSRKGLDLIDERNFREMLGLAYLTEKGEAPETKMRPVKTGTILEDAPALQAFFKEHGYKPGFAKGDEYHLALTAAYKAGMDEYLQKLLAVAEDAEDEALSRKTVARMLDGDLDEEGLLLLFDGEKLIREAPKMGTFVPDPYAMQDAIVEALKSRKKDFEKWAKAKIKPALGERYIRKVSDSGNERSIPYTLQNILRELTRKIRQGENFNYGLGTARAAGSKRFRSIEEIRAAQDKIVPSEEFRKLKDAMDERFSKLAESLGGGSTRPLHNLAEAIGESYKPGRSLAKELKLSLFDDLSPEQVEQVAKFAEDLLAMPTEYFEAKPQRAVDLSEFKAAVVPEGVDKDALAALKKAGIERIVTYSKGDEKARADAIERAGRASDIFFQPAFHGTPSLGIDKFSLTKIGTGEGAQAYGWGLYFAESQEVAEFYRRKLTRRRLTAKSEAAALTTPSRWKAFESLERLVDDFGTNPEKTLQMWQESLNGLAATAEESAQKAKEWNARAPEETTAEDVADYETKAREAREAAEWAAPLKPEDFDLGKGRVYKVELPENDRLLDWDTDLRRQPEVFAKLQAAGIVRSRGGNWVLPNGEVKDFYAAKGRITGRDLYLALVESTGGQRNVRTEADKAASLALDAAGIPGLRFLDRGSRTAGEGTHNFVIWNEQEVRDIATFYAEEEGVARGWLESAKVGVKRVMEVFLTKDANLSTFMHETGHAYLELMGDLAGREDVQAEFKADYEAILKFLEVGDGKSIGREQHEKFARAFETYLFEGKAPSLTLAEAFRRFASWLKRIYKSIKGLNVELNPEIRAVFDRMLATDEEIAVAQRQSGLQPMFRSPAEAGMSPAEWQAYLKSREESLSHANKAARLSELRQALKDAEGTLADKQAKIAEQAKLEYELLPASRASTYLTEGLLVADDGMTVNVGLLEGQKPRPNREESVEILGEDAVRAIEEKLGRGIWGNQGGPSLDGIASLFGYETAQDLADALAAHPTEDSYVKARVEERTHDELAALTNERDELAADVSKGLHGDATGAWLLAEWHALRQKARPGSGPAPIDAIKASARQIVRGQKVGSLNAGKALQDERVAGDRALKAAAKGDFEGAHVFKQQQMLNFYIHRETVAALEEKAAFLKLAKLLRKDSTRGKLGRGAPEVLRVTDGILEALYLTPAQEHDDAPNLDAAARRLEADGLSILFEEPPISTLLANPRDWRTLAVEEAENVHNALAQFHKYGVDWDNVLLGERLAERDHVVATLVDEAQKNLPKRPPPPSSEAARGMASSVVSLAHGIDGELLRPETMLSWLGGKDQQSAWFQAIIEPLQRAKVAEYDILETAIAPIVEAFEKIPKNVRNRTGDSIDGAKLFPYHRPDLAPPSKRFELLMLALNMGNDSNKERLLEGRHISEEQAWEALKLLTKEEWDWVQSVWDACDSLFPAARDLERRVSGIAPKKITPTPFTTSFGVYRGGYFPAVYDRRAASEIGERQALDSISSLMDSSFTRPWTPHSHLKKRAEHFADALILDPSALMAHLAQVAHDLAFREPLRSVGSLVIDPRVQAVLKERLGFEKSGQFLQYLKDVGQMRGGSIATHSTARALTNVLRKMRSNMAVATLGYAADVALGDLSNLAVALTGLKTKHWAAGLSEFAASPVKMRRFALEKSGELRFRKEGVARELQAHVGNIAAKNPLSRNLFGWWKKYAFVFMEATDAGTATPIWLGAYRQGLAEAGSKGLGDGEADSYAVTFADKTIRKFFPSHSAVDQAAALRDKGFVGSSLLFYGYFNVVFQRYRDALHDLYVAAHEGDTKAQKTWSAVKASPAFAAQVAGLMISVTLLGDFLTGRGPEPEDGEDERERWLNWLKRKMMLAPVQSLPFVSGPVESVALGKQPSVRSGPAFAALDQVGKTLWKASQEEGDTTKTVEAALKALAMVAGVPGARPIRACSYLLREEGAAQANSPVDVAAGVIYGADSNTENRPENPLRMLSK